MKHTIEKIDGNHWIIDGEIHIKFDECFAGTGWFIDDNRSTFKNPEDNFLYVLEKALKENKSKPKLMPKPVGIGK